MECKRETYRRGSHSTPSRRHGTWNLRNWVTNPHPHTPTYTHKSSQLTLGGFRLQEMDLGKSAYVVYDPTYEMEWTAAISPVLGDHYEKITSHQLIGIFLMVFANKALIPAISAVEKSHLPTGHFSLLGNKGGVAIRLQCYDSTLCFVDVHLYHAVEGVVKRTEDFRRIIKELVFEHAEKIKAHDHVFCFGDLNYRVNVNWLPMILMGGG